MFGSTNSKLVMLRLTPSNLNKTDQHLGQFIINCMNEWYK